MGIIRVESRATAISSRSPRKLLDTLSEAMPEIVKALENNANSELVRLSPCRVLHAQCQMPASVFKLYKGRRFDTEVCDAIKQAMREAEPKTYKVGVTIPFRSDQLPLILAYFDPGLS